MRCRLEVIFIATLLAVSCLAGCDSSEGGSGKASSSWIPSIADPPIDEKTESGKSAIPETKPSVAKKIKKKREKTEGKVYTIIGRVYGCFKDGKVYNTNNTIVLGSYKNGNFYSPFNKIVGTYRDGNVFYLNGRLAGTYRAGKLYYLNNRVAGKYDEGGGPAAAFLFLFL